MRKRIVALVLCGLMVFVGSTPSIAADVTTNDPIVVSPQMENINRSTADLFIDTAGNATIKSSVQGFSGITNRVKISAKLQKYVDGSWKTIETFTAENDSYSVSLKESYKVSKGYTYRVRSTVYAYSDSSSEIKTVTSSEVLKTEEIRKGEYLMKKNKFMKTKHSKKIISLLLALAVWVVGAGMPQTIVHAADDTNQEQIDRLFDEITENLAIFLLNEDSEDNKNIEAENAQIEEKLSELGVKQLNDEELLEFFAERGIVSTRVSKPSDSNTVKWYLYTSRNLTYGSKKYDVQRLVAVGNNPGGMLVTGGDNEEFYSDEQKLVNGAKYAASIYAQKAIGLVKFIQWTPYELLFSSSSSDVFNSSYITHRCVSSIEFSYVKDASLSDASFRLCKFSNKLSIASNAHGAAVKDSKPETYSVQKNGTISSDNYGSTSSAMKAYANNTVYYDYIPFYELRSYDDEYSKTASVPNPLAGPGQVY